jgi:mono/diheme cytochrome c family protein
MRWPSLVLIVLLAFTACRGADADLPPAYRHLDVPEARLQSAEARAQGRTLFLSHCALCHGKQGNGHGRREMGLSTAPADFTDPSWRSQATPRHVFFWIREGVQGTPMPAWRALSDDETWDLVAYVLSLSPVARQ